jgi:phosphate-selective porin OprO/OprP
MVAIAAQVFAEPVVTVPKTIEQRLAELESEIRLLKRQREVEQEVQLKKENETPIVISSKDGFSLKSKDENFQIKFKGQIQADGRFFIGNDTPTGYGTFLLRKVRPTLEGTVYKYFDFKLMPDFGNGTASIQDAYVDFKYWKAASLRVGKFKSPIGLERLQTDAWTALGELSLASNLVPNRDIGVDLHGELLNGTVSYDIGVFNGSYDLGSNDTDNHDDKDLVARIFTQPFKNSTVDALNGFGVGVGGSIGSAHGTTTNAQLPVFKTFGQQTIDSYATGVYANGRRMRVSPQAYYYYGPLGVLGEFMASSQRITRLTTDSATVINTGGNLTASYVLTGENASYNGVTPRNNFDPKKGKYGAVEFVSTFNWLNPDANNFNTYINPKTSTRDAIAWGFGFNWYLNKFLKVVTDFNQTHFQAGNYNGQDRKVENVILSRLQLLF